MSGLGGLGLLKQCYPLGRGGRDNKVKEVCLGIESIDSNSFQTHGACQLLLAIIKRPEALRFEFESGGNVQGVEGTQAKFGGVSSGKLGANVKDRFRHANFNPRSALTVLLKSLVVEIAFVSRKCPSKDVLFNGMSPLGNMKGSQPHDGAGSHALLCLPRVHVG